MEEGEWRQFVSKLDEEEHVAMKFLESVNLDRESIVVILAPIVIERRKQIMEAE